jgi:acyl dehydratase
VADDLGPDAEVELDLSDIEPRVGQRTGGGQITEPCTAMDIRRWVMGMDYPNPIHWNDDFARASKFGRLVAPQSMVKALDWGHGTGASIAGKLKDSHYLFGGEEWWFYGHRITPGDHLLQERRLHDYRVVQTKFAGPTVVQRGDTVHRTQHGALVAKLRSTGIRYLASEADKRQSYSSPDQPKAPVWTREELQKVAKIRRDWILSNRDGVSPRYEEIKVGDQLPTRVIGPHTIATFATEWRAFASSAWGSYKWVGVPGMADPWINQDPGFIEGLVIDYEEAKIDPRHTDGLYIGPAAGHIDTEKGAEIGIPRAYGYGASMGAWPIDYLAYWAGHDGMVRHINMSFRAPCFEGDVSYFEGQVVAKHAESAWGAPLVVVRVKIASQDGAVLVEGVAEVEVPL